MKPIAEIVAALTAFIVGFSISLTADAGGLPDSLHTLGVEGDGVHFFYRGTRSSSFTARCPLHLAPPFPESLINRTDDVLQKPDI
jgi:hypothetical protein